MLAKLLGFYTVEVKNLETGATQAKADLLVMENLFAAQEIVKTFDLKGIQGRKVKPASNSSGSKTLFDGDWIEGVFYRLLFYLYLNAQFWLARSATCPDVGAAVLKGGPARGYQSRLRLPCEEQYYGLLVSVHLTLTTAVAS